jgi:DNA-binding NtrC family response regulator
MLCAVLGSRSDERLTARILVVDDEPGMRRSLAIVLRREHYHVTETGSVAEAVGRLRGESYDLVIADLRMEPLNGFDLLALVRQYHPRCPVIIMTAYATPEARSDALQFGATDFLEKPLQAPDLLLRIQEILTPGTGR